MTIFDQPVNRRNTNSYKWDSHPEYNDVTPLWVADMDFKAAPPIMKALQRRLDMGVFGYTYVPDSYYRATIDWFECRHHWRFNREDIIYTSGVVPAISAIIKALSKPGEKVVIMTPVYNCFFSSIRNNGCIPSESPLVCTPSGDENIYTIDFDDLEKRCAEPDATILLLCNPHNPVGRVWTTDELRRIDLIASRCGVTVVSDEIHCEITFPGHEYTPFALVATQPCVTCVSPSKAFNIAGLQIANIIANEPVMRAKIDKAININEVCDVNPFGVDALIAAYNEGEEWLGELLEYIHGNYLMVKKIINEQAPGFRLSPLEGTYLAWLDCRHLGMGSDRLEEILKERAKVWLNSGTMYGKAGDGFLRINLACQRETLREAIERIVNTIMKFGC